jgi:short-subunit dehydrogenase
VGIVVNNAGIGMYTPYIDSPLQPLINCYRLNLLSVLSVTKTLL